MNRLVVTAIALVGALFIATTATAKAPQVVIETSMGTVVVELNPEKAPITVKNFLQYVDAKHYDGLIFHRVIPTFMIQGGGFDAELVKKETRGPIKLEAGNGLSNLRGTIAMARTAVRDSATNQFFINVKDNRQLDAGGGGYAVFGTVIRGMEVVDKIKAVPTTTRRQYANVPVTPVVIKSIRRAPAK